MVGRGLSAAGCGWRLSYRRQHADCHFGHTSGGVFKLVLVDSVFTATGAGIGPFRYVILYDSSASNKLIGSYDNGASVTLNAGDTFTVDFDNVAGVFTIT